MNNFEKGDENFMEKANSEIINLITNRRSHRKYINKKIPKDIIETIINCGRHAPFGGNQNRIVK